MKNTAKKKAPTADEIAELAMKGEDVSSFFTNKGEMRPPIQRVNVDFTLDMLKELDAIARDLNISAYSDEIATWFRSIPPLRSEALRHPCRSVATLVNLCCQNSSF